MVKDASEPGWIPHRSSASRTCESSLLAEEGVLLRPETTSAQMNADDEENVFFRQPVAEWVRVGS